MWKWIVAIKYHYKIFKYFQHQLLSIEIENFYVFKSKI